MRKKVVTRKIQNPCRHLVVVVVFWCEMETDGYKVYVKIWRIKSKHEICIPKVRTERHEVSG